MMAVLTYDIGALKVVAFDTKQNTHTATGPQRCAICNLYSCTKPQDAARKLAVKARNPVDSMLTTET